MHELSTDMCSTIKCESTYDCESYILPHSDEEIDCKTKSKITLTAERDLIESKLRANKRLRHITEEYVKHKTLRTARRIAYSRNESPILLQRFTRITQLLAACVTDVKCLNDLLISNAICM